MRLRPGDWVIVALICAGHLADIPLVRTGHKTVSVCGRRWAPFWLAFTWHVFHPRKLDRYDLWWLTANRWDTYMAPRRAQQCPRTD